VLVNYSFTLEIFHDDLKLANVVPIYKRRNKQIVSNYRPISIFSNITKIFEKLFHKRLNAFFCNPSVIAQTQYGFRSSLSTMNVVLDVLTSTYDNSNAKKYTGLIFLDIKKRLIQLIMNNLHNIPLNGDTPRVNTWMAIIFNLYKLLCSFHFSYTPNVCRWHMLLLKCFNK